MKKMMISYFTRTPLHVGCGSSVGAVDMPVLRERATDLPVIPGSTIKGVLADLFLDTDLKRDNTDNNGVKLFGSEDPDKAARGTLMIGEARLLAFPVRSAKGGFVWATSPLLLARCGIQCNQPLDEMDGYGSEKVAFDNAFVLEEYKIDRKDNVDTTIIEALKEKCDLSLWQSTLADRLVILSDTMLTYFAKNACEIAHHNKIDDETGTVAQGALFSQENVPSEALFVGEIMSYKDGEIEKLKTAIEQENNLLQIGGNATTGLGWCQITMGEIK